MKFGVFSVVDHYPNDLPRTVSEFYNELLDHAELADECGFDSFWVAEHHFHEYGAIPSPPVWMGAASARTKRIRLGVAVSVLPFHNPLVVAEEYAMVDILSAGRLDFGAGSGYLKHEFAGFNIPMEEKYDRFGEALEVIKSAWRGGRFSFQGKYVKVNDLALQIAPVQKPHPPIFVATLRNEAAPGVGRQGYPLMTIPYAGTEDLSELSQMVSDYKKAFMAAEAPVSRQPRAVCALHTHIASSRGVAEKEARPALDRYVTTRLYAKSRGYDVLKEKGLAAVGDPDDVIKTIRRYEECGFDTFLAILDFGGLGCDEVGRSIELFAKYVLPAFKK